MKGLNLKNFKKIADDKDKAVLRNNFGHEITIAKRTLPPDLVATLSSLPLHLADGGYINSSNQKGALKENYKKMADGGDVDEGDESDNQPDDVDIKDDYQTEGNPNGVAPTTDKVQQTAPQAEPPTDTTTPPPQPDEQQASAPVTPPVAPSPTPAPAVQQVPTKQQLDIEDKNFQQDLQDGHITPKTYRDLMFKNEDGTEKSGWGKLGTVFAMMIGGAGAGLAHQDNIAMKMMDNEIRNDIEAQKQSKANSQNLYKLNLEHQLNIANIKTQQAQQALMGQQTTSLKEKTPAEIAQIESIANANNQEARIKADALTHMQENRLALHHLGDEVNKMMTLYGPNDTRTIQAQQKLMMISQQIDTMNSNLADKAQGSSLFMNALIGSGGGGTSNDPETEFQKNQQFLRVTGKGDLANENEAHHMPNFNGKSSKPLTENDRDSLTTGVTFQKSLGAYKDFVQSHGNIPVNTWSYKDRVRGEALAADLQSAYRNAQGLGVYRAGEQEFVSKLIDSTPSKFLNDYTVIPKLEAIKTDSMRQLNDKAKSLGFTGINASREYQPGGAQQQQQTPNNPKQAPQQQQQQASFKDGDVRFLNGKQYVRQNGKWFPKQ